MPEVCGRSEYANTIAVRSKNTTRQNNLELWVRIFTRGHLEEK